MEGVLSSTLRRAFHVLTITLLSLLLPFSFLLLARLSIANFSSSQDPPEIAFLLSLFFRPGNPNPIHAVVSVISMSALLHGLAGWSLFSVSRPTAAAATGGQFRLSMAWALLCALQVLVGLGIEGSIASGIGGFQNFDVGRCLASGAFFFLGLQGTMAHWSRAVVRPVVDDTVYGEAGVGAVRQWPEKAAAYGGLWWWRLRYEVDSMVIVPRAKKELSMGVGVVDFVGWWLYYLTVTIGMVRFVKGLLRVASLLLCRRLIRHKLGASYYEQDTV